MINIQTSLIYISALKIGKIVKSCNGNNFMVKKKLATLHTMKYARKIRDPFVNGLKCPYKNKNKVDIFS